MPKGYPDTVTCPNCGEGWPAEFAYCPNCGAKLPIHRWYKNLKVKVIGDGIPQKYCFPIHSKMWDRLLELGYTGKQLTDWGFVKAT